VAASLSARLGERLRRQPVLPVADGVWRVTGGFPLTNHVYLIAEEDGVTVFDAGAREMAPLLVRALAGRRLVHVLLGHSHWDHRGAAPALARLAPVMCHPTEVADAQADGGRHYFHMELHRSARARWLLGELMRRRDGGPVAISQTVAAGDRVGEFEVVEVPGHSPGQIALVRQRDRLALVSDAIYTVDADSGRKCGPRAPHPAYNFDDARACQSIRELAGMGLRELRAGHADPVTDDVRRRLLRAAEREGDRHAS
jgi:hydroxyacylglutathione hydrolase